MKISHHLQTRFRDCDAFGHVNNAVYLNYLEEARCTWLEALIAKRPIELRDIPIILASVHIDYLSPARFREDLQIDVQVARVGRKSFDLTYELRAGDRLLAKASTVQVYFDYDAQCSIPIPEEMRERLSETL
jgi:acyl-CoA thioester hydrolase